MKNRLRAIILAAGLVLAATGGSVYAGEAAEAVSEAAEAVSEAVSEAEEAVSEMVSEAAETVESEVKEADGDGKYAAYYDSIKETIPPTLQALSEMTEEYLDQIIAESQNAQEIAIAANWKAVREELGNYVEVTNQEITEDGSMITVINDVTYDGVDKNTNVQVKFEYDFRDQTSSLSWDVQYTFAKLMQQAGLNTLMGLGIVFLVLLFLSFIIGQLHWIPDLIEGRKKKAVPEAPAAPAAAPAVSETAEEEDLTDDLELVAVITAAIAASENTSTDGFVVRSIRKANRRKWQSA